jgi:hypothetical protein
MQIFAGGGGKVDYQEFTFCEHVEMNNASEFSGVAGELRYTACIAHKSLRICEQCRLHRTN